MYSIHVLPREMESWRMKGMRFSFIEQICTQFMMDFTTPSLGVVTLKVSTVLCHFPTSISDLLFH